LSNYKISNIIFVRQALPDKPSVGDIVEFMGKHHFQYEATVTSVDEKTGAYFLSEPVVKGKRMKNKNVKNGQTENRN
jgi:hypothetical protein